MNSLVVRLGATRRRLDPDWMRSRFLAVGVLNTLFGLGIFPLLMWIFWPYRRYYLAFVVVSFILCTTFSYLTNKFLTFRTKGRYLSELGKFASFYLGGFIGNLTILPLCVEIFHLPIVPSQLAYSVLGTFLAYFWHGHVTFRSRKINRRSSTPESQSGTLRAGE